MKRIEIIKVSGNLDAARLEAGGQTYPVKIGKQGLVSTDEKREGDEKTPLGLFPLLYVLWRPDRLDQPKTFLPCKPLSPNMAWCDDPEDKLYNRAVDLPYQGRCEKLWREDALYDIIVPLGFNQEARPYHGSAIFLHCTAGGATKGCVAMEKESLLALLENCDSNTSILIQK